MRYLPTKKTVRALFAAEGYLELQLPQRALLELDRLEASGELEPYSLYLRGQALQQLDRYEEAIDALHEAARTIPSPFNRKVWEDLSQCFRHQGLEELADVAELFANDPAGGADREFAEDPAEESLSDFDQEFAFDVEDDSPWNRYEMSSADDFEDYNFEEGWDEFGTDCDEDSRSPHHKRPRK